MFKIKMRCYDCGNRFAYVDYGVQTYTTAEDALKDLIKDIKDELETLNNGAKNCEFKVTFENENALAIVQKWEGTEDVETDRDYQPITEYDIVYCGSIQVDFEKILPNNWIN